MSSEKFSSKQEKRQFFPNWVRDPEYLPTMEELKELHNDDRWDDFIHHNPHGNEFQILSKEFIESLAEALLCEIDKLSKDSIQVIEVGAGNGRLTHFLRQAIENKKTTKQIMLRAIDDYSWDKGMASSLTPIWIKKIFAEEGKLEDELNNNPDVVISSWMPKGPDWTEAFRKNESIQLFVLIGDPDECGIKETWEDTDKFEGKTVDTEATVCWSDYSPNSHMPRSQVAFFSRRK